MSVSLIRNSDAEPSPRLMEEVGLAAAVDGGEEKFPLLVRSLRNASPLHNVKAEWLVRTGKELATWFNWTIIVRTPFSVTNAGLANSTHGGTSLWEKTKDEMLQRHLGSIENNIRDGRLFRQIDYYLDEETGEWYPVETRGMGGAKFFLRREPTADDQIDLRILRDCVFLDQRQAPDVDGRTAEFLSEFSLQVRPAALQKAA